MNWNFYKKKNTNLGQLWLCATLDERLRWYSGIRVTEKDWNNKLRASSLSEVKASLDKIENIYKEIKRQLSKKEILTAYNAKFLLDCESIHKAENYINEIQECINRIPHKGEFMQCFDLFIKASEDGTRKTKKGKRLSENAIEKYRVTRNLLKEFSKKTGYELIWKNINNEFYDKLTNYCWHTLDAYDNYTGLQVNIIKSLLNWLSDEEIGIIPNKIYTKKWISWSEEETDALVLYPDELKILHQMTIEHDKVDKIRDIFIVGCLTCLRAGDLLKLTEADLNIIGGSWYINPIQEKVDKSHWLKLHHIAVAILEKHRGKYPTLLPNYSHGEYADNLKTLARMLKDHISTIKIKDSLLMNDWDKPFTKTRYKQGKPYRIQVSITSILNPHTERATGITSLLMMGMREYEVKKVSGHTKNSKSFGKYVRFAQRFIDAQSDQAFDKIFHKDPILKVS